MFTSRRHAAAAVIAASLVGATTAFAASPVQAGQGSKACPSGTKTTAGSLFEQYRCGYPSGRPGGR